MNFLPVLRLRASSVLVAFFGLSCAAFAQDQNVNGNLNVTGAANISGNALITGDVGASHVVSSSGRGDSAFYGNQAGSTFGNSQPIYAAVSDNPNGNQNWFFRGKVGGTAGAESFSIRADGQIRSAILAGTGISLLGVDASGALTRMGAVLDTSGNLATAGNLAAGGSLAIGGGASFGGNIAIGGNGYSLYGPNSGWGMSLRVGGNGNVTNDASVVTTSGNLHLDPAAGPYSVYLNYYHGTSGVRFGNGASGQVGYIDSAGNLAMSGQGFFAGNLGVGGSVTALSPSWRAAGVMGPDGLNKVVIGPLVSTYTGATIGAYNSGLTAWADLNVAGKNLIFRANGETEVARFTSAGNLGIGTANPNGLLSVQSPVAGVPQLYITKSDSGTPSQNGGALTFENNHPSDTGRSSGVQSGTINFNYSQPTSGVSQLGASIQGVSDYVQTGGDTPTAIAFGTFNSPYYSGIGVRGFAERVRIASNGNVGIGTANPNGLLSVQSSVAGVSQVYITKSDGGTPNQDGGVLTFENNHLHDTTRSPGVKSGAINFNYSQPTSGVSQLGASMQGVSDYPQSGGDTPTAITFGTFNSPYYSSIGVRGFAERVRIASNGNLGVGTIAPAAKLDVLGKTILRGTVDIPPSGDLSMGSFTTGSNPATQ